MKTYSESWLNRNRRKYLTRKHYATIVSGEKPVAIDKPNGQPLLRFLPGVLPRHLCEGSHAILRRAGNRYSNMRGFYSATIGNMFDATIQDCRRTEFTAKDIQGWYKFTPLARAVDRVYASELPEYHAVQKRHAEATNPYWIIAQTVFTTVTVNLWDETHDGRTYVHIDKRDLPDGFGVLTVLRSGDYKGGQLVFPRYRVAVDLQTTDVLLFDPHEPHGNIAIEGAPGWERIACVFYFMSDVEFCPNLT